MNKRKRVEILNKISELEPIFLEKQECVDKQMLFHTARTRDREKMKVVEICRLIKPDKTPFSRVKNIREDEYYTRWKIGYKFISEYLGYTIESNNLESLKLIIREINLSELE